MKRIIFLIIVVHFKTIITAQISCDLFDRSYFIEKTNYTKNDFVLRDTLDFKAVLYCTAKKVIALGNFDKKGRFSGYWKFFDENGKVITSGIYLKGLREGSWRFDLMEESVIDIYHKGKIKRGWRVCKC